jgi:hypothetical protein
VPRSLTIHMPNGPTEYWFTALIFEVGDKFERAGETWVVTSIGETDQASGKHVSVTVRRDEAPTT